MIHLAAAVYAIFLGIFTLCWLEWMLEILLVLGAALYYGVHNRALSCMIVLTSMSFVMYYALQAAAWFATRTGS